MKIANTAKEVVILTASCYRFRICRRRLFSSLGVRKPIINALNSGFPHILEPTPCQKKLIPTVMSGKDVFFQDAMGTGKFGLRYFKCETRCLILLLLLNDIELLDCYSASCQKDGG